MFKKLKSLFERKDLALQPEPPPNAASPPPAAAAPPPQKRQARSAPSPPPKPPSPEEICGITPEMTPDEIRARLAFLYRRYNQAAASLNAGLRAEAEQVLTAIVIAREKHFGPI